MAKNEKKRCYSNILPKNLLKGALNLQSYCNIYCNIGVTFTVTFWQNVTLLALFLNIIILYK